jgi:hypothetical protein
LGGEKESGLFVSVPESGVSKNSKGEKMEVLVLIIAAFLLYKIFKRKSPRSSHFENSVTVVRAKEVKNRSTKFAKSDAELAKQPTRHPSDRDMTEYERQQGVHLEKAVKSSYQNMQNARNPQEKTKYAAENERSVALMNQWLKKNGYQ